MNDYIKVKKLIDMLEADMRNGVCNITYAAVDHHRRWTIADYVVRHDILKTIYKNGGCYIHWFIRGFIFEHQDPYSPHGEKWFEKFMKDFCRSDKTRIIKSHNPMPDEKLVLNEKKEPLTWWKDTLKSYMEEVI